MSERNIIVLGTNQYYQSPYTILANYLESYDKSEITNKKEGTISFKYTFFPKPIKVNLVFLKNLDQTYSICKMCNNIVIFIDLEKDDSLEKLDSILSFIFEECSFSKTIFVIGKYNTIEDKIKLYDEEYMKQYLQEKSLLCTYFEFCTEPKEEFDEKMGNFLLALIGDFDNNKLKSDKLIMNQEEIDSINQDKEYDATSSKFGCILQ